MPPRDQPTNYQSFFGSDPVDDFSREIEVLEQEGLVRVDDGSIEPTPYGMFYADSIAAILASKAIKAHRKERTWGEPPEYRFLIENGNQHGYM